MMTRKMRLAAGSAPDDRVDECSQFRKVGLSSYKGKIIVIGAAHGVKLFRRLGGSERPSP
jgi:hypothetical protein